VPEAAPRETAIGSLGHYVSHADPRHYQPSNITFGIMPPLDAPPRNRHERQLAMSQRALAALEAWAAEEAERPVEWSTPRLAVPRAARS
jgi:methylenetetrahydrofolate--tRNA-(uracil-5-)-methyltransferase